MAVWNMATAMVHSSDDFVASALERADLDVIEATLSWENDVLEVRHVPPGRALTVGEVAGVDFTIPESELGAPSLAVLDGGGALAFGSVERVVAGTGDLRAGAPTVLSFGAFRLTLRVVPAGRGLPVSMLDSIRESALGSVGGSFLFHAMLFAAFAMFLPALGGDDADGITREQLLTMQKYLDSASERERERIVESLAEESDGASEAGAAGTMALGESGAMGTPTSPKTNAHYSARGDASPHDATLARERELKDARESLMVGLLASAGIADPNAPVAPWGTVLNGADAESHLGAMWGDAPGENFGIGGLGLSGVGEGGCPPGARGCGQGIGLADVGGLGHSLRDHMGKCVGPNCDGAGNGHSPLRGGHEVRTPRVRTCGDQSCGFETSGRLPPEVIQRIVRQNMGRYRACYEAGLRGNPSLTGHVRVKFVIDRTGAVASALDSGSDIPDQNVRSCVVRNFYSLAFPAPQGGTVNVVYPILLLPEG